MTFDPKTFEAILTADPTDPVVKDILAAIEKAKCSPEAKGAFAAASKIAGAHLTDAKKAKLAKIFSDDNDDNDDDDAQKSAELLARMKAALGDGAINAVDGVDLSKVDKEYRPIFEKVLKEAEEVKKQLAVEKSAREMQETMIEVRKDFGGLPIAAEEFAPMWLKVKKGIPLDFSEREMFALIFKSASEIIGQSLLFKSITAGNEDGDVAGMTAEEEIAARANEIVAKSGVGKDGHPVINFAHAVTEVTQKNPGLYARSQLEKQAANGR